VARTAQTDDGDAHFGRKRLALALVAMLLVAGGGGGTAVYVTLHVAGNTLRTLGVAAVLALAILAAAVALAIGTTRRALRDSKSNERWYRHLFHASIIPGIVTTPDGKILDANTALATLLGYTRDELLQLPAKQLWASPTDRDALFRQTPTSDSSDTFEAKLRTKDGAEIDCLLNATVRLAPDGTVLARHGTVRDASQRRRMEDALRVSEQRFRQLADSVPCLYSYVDADLRYRFVSQRYEDWFGLPTSEITGMRIENLVGPEVWETMGPRVMQVLAGDPVRFEMVAPYRGAGTRNVEAEYQPDVDDEGRVRGFTALIYDITARKKTEEALQTSESNLQELADNIPDAFFAMDSNLQCTYWNKTAEALTGVRAADAIGRRMFDLFPGVKGTEVERLYHLVSETHRPATGEQTYKLGHQTHVFELRAYPRADGIAGLARDITERRHLEEEVGRITAHERRRIGQDLHDTLGSSLTALALLTKALRQDLVAEGWGEAAGIARKLEGLVKRATAETRFLSRGLLRFPEEPSRVADLFQDLADSVSDLYGIPCTVDVDRAIELRGRVVEQLYHIAQEAITNAVRHGRATTLSLTLHAPGDAVELTVQSDGLPVPELAPMTDGLGLGIMHARANLIGGLMAIRAGEEGGTIVRCTVQPRTLQTQRRARHG
jgi:PAS domain S-box-containing protein